MNCNYAAMSKPNITPYVTLHSCFFELAYCV